MATGGDAPVVLTPLLHIVALRFRPELTDAEIVAHFERDVALSRRMPELVAAWVFKRNVSLTQRSDVNGGCGWVVISRLHDATRLSEYLAHTEHHAIAAIQSSLITSKFVVDCEGAGVGW